MINNLENLFSKYTENLQIKKDLKNQTLNFFTNKFNLPILSKNIKIDLKKQEVKLINLSASYKYILHQKITKEILEEFRKTLNLNLKI